MLLLKPESGAESQVEQEEEDSPHCCTSEVHLMVKSEVQDFALGPKLGNKITRDPVDVFTVLLYLGLFCQ